MSLENEFLFMASTSVLIEPHSSQSDYGTPIFGAGVTYTAVVQQEVRAILKGDGVTNIDVTAVYVMSSSATVGLQDRLTLPSGRQPPILAVWTERDNQGQHHVEVICGL